MLHEDPGELEQNALGDLMTDINILDEEFQTSEDENEQYRICSTSLEPSMSVRAFNSHNSNTLRNIINFDGVLPPEFPQFGYFDSGPIAIHILHFLSAVELCNVSNSCKSMYMITLSPALWKHLLIVDFVLDEQQIAAINATPNLHQTEPGSAAISASKKYYAQQVREVCRNAGTTRAAKMRMDKEMLRDRRVKCIECCLDTSMVRLFVLLPPAAFIATLILVGMRTDGLDISIWICLSPLLCLVGYTLFSAAVTYIVYRRRNSTTGLIQRELWTNFRSPAQMFFEATDSPRAAKCAVGVCFLLLLQLMALGVKISTSDTIPHTLHSGLHWGVVFLPIWILFALFLVSPALGIYSGPGPFLGLLLTAWMPLFILFACLTVKLTGIEEHKREGRMRLALIMMPFWIMEGLILLGSLIMVVIGVHRLVIYDLSLLVCDILDRYRQGFLERDSMLERVGVFAVFWILLSPFVIFQSFMSARDDETGDLSLLEALSPLITIIGFAFLFSFIFASKFITPFEVSYTTISLGQSDMSLSFQQARAQREMDAAGTRVLFEV